MRTKKYLGLIVILTVLVSLLMATGVSAAGATKSDICHLDKDAGIFFLINISDNAFQAHLDHGDVAPGGAVPDMPGMIFGSDCAVLPIGVTGTWTGLSGLAGNLTYPFTMHLVQDLAGNVTGDIDYGAGFALRTITGNVTGVTLTFTQTDPGGYWATVSGPVTATTFTGLGTDSNLMAVGLDATR